MLYDHLRKQAQGIMSFVMESIPPNLSLEELLGRFAVEHGVLHTEWTNAVGTPSYVKQVWRDLDNKLCRMYRDALTRVGYPITVPMLREGAR